MAYEGIEAFEGYESESEAAEARTPVRRPSSQPSFRPRQPPAAAQNYVTQVQLEASLARSDAKIKTVADGVSTIQARLTSLASASKKEADDRKKSVDGQSKDLNQKLQMLALLPLLIQPAVITNPKDGSGNALTMSDGTTPIPALAAGDTSKLDALLPLLLVSGMGGAGGISLGGDGTDGNSMMMLALVLAFARP